MSEETVQTSVTLAEEGYLRMRRWLRYLLLFSLVILSVMLWSELPETGPGAEPSRPSIGLGPEDNYIRPGDRVGFVRLGLSIQQVEQRLGRGRAKPTQTAVLYRFDQAGLTCAVQRGHITSILVTNPNLKTVGGIGVGIDSDLVVRELGDSYEYEPVERPGPSPESVPKAVGYTLHYWREGVHVTLVQDKVESILVTEPTGNS